MRRNITLIAILLGAVLTLVGFTPANAGTPGDQICLATPSPVSGSVCTPGGVCIPRISCPD